VVVGDADNVRLVDEIDVVLEISVELDVGSLEVVETSVEVALLVELNVERLVELDATGHTGTKHPRS
jgi:hypothetical protein